MRLYYQHGVIGKVETLLILLALVGILAVLSSRLKVSFPIMMVIGGVVVALIPNLPPVYLDPDLILYVFLPPLLYSAAFAFPWEQLRSNMRPILGMAVGLVLATVVCVALAAHWWIPGIPLAAAFVLGAIVSPPDAVAATVVLEKMRVPQRLSTVLEGESLVNDSSGLVAYAFAVSAVVTGSFSIAGAAIDFVWMSIGGVAFGVFIGWGAARLHKQIAEPGIGMILQLLTPYMAYLPAEKIGVSGVLAAVAAGLYVGRESMRVLNPETRLNGVAVWGFLNFVLNGTIFILIGLHFPTMMEHLSGYPIGQLLVWGALISAVVVAVRFVCIFSFSSLYRRVVARNVAGGSNRGAQLVMSWAGMRGAVSLAAAMAIPLATDAGEAFPARNLIMFLTYSVIFSTLVFQGFTLPWVVRKSGIEESESDYEKEGRARKLILERAIEMIDAEASSPTSSLSEITVQILRDHFQTRLNHFRMREATGATTEGLPVQEMDFLVRLMSGTRSLLVDLRNRGEINEHIRRGLTQEIDAEEQRLRRVMYRGVG